MQAPQMLALLSMAHATARGHALSPPRGRAPPRRSPDAARDRRPTRDEALARPAWDRCTRRLAVQRWLGATAAASAAAGAAAPAVASLSGKVTCRDSLNSPGFLGDLASRPTPEPSAGVQRNSTSSEHVLDFLRASGLVASSRSGARCARTWAPSAVQIATSPPLLFVHGSPGCAGGGRMPVGDSNALATRRQLPGRWDRGDRRRSAHS